MGQQQSNPQVNSARNYHFKPNSVKLENEGILKLRSTPFPSCVEIETDNQTLFLEDAQMSLADLLQNRFYTNRLFMVEDIYKLIEGISYTLAFLEENGTLYKDLTTDNIYYTNGSFKLLPNELIEMSTYERARTFSEAKRKQKQNEEESTLPYLSPELIIALRYKERKIDDFEIMQKSTVFILGLILLEATTLMPSSECFDESTYDIFNTIISERLEIIEEHYNQKVARIVANMLDYDYCERMNPKSLSIWINRQLSVEKQNLENSAFHPEKAKGKTKLNKSNVNKSIMKSNVSEKQIESSQPLKTFSRTNLVYINGSDVEEEDETSIKHYPQKGGPKNQIYLNEKFAAKDHFLQEYTAKLQSKNSVNKFEQEKEKPQKYMPSRKLFEKSPSLSSYGREPIKIRDLCAQEMQEPDYLQTLSQKEDIQEPMMANRSKLDRNPYYKPPKPSQNQPLKMKSMNKYFPNLDDFDKGKPLQTKRVAQHYEVGSQKFQSKKSEASKQIDDSSINRIKVEIEKSRKLIEEFRKTEAMMSN